MSAGLAMRKFKADLAVGSTIAPVRKKVVSFMLVSKAGEELIHKAETQYLCAALRIQQVFL
jgi:hypothetical protein